MAEQLILIVDDQPQNLQVLSTTLRQAGYQVAAATSGLMAFRILDRRLPDLVLCDVMMPDMDGYEVCRRLKASSRFMDIPLMFITAMTDSDAILHGFESGAVDYVTKPFNTGELLARVRTQLELRQARLTIQAYASKMDLLSTESDSDRQQKLIAMKDSLQAVLQQTMDLERQSPSLSQDELTERLQEIQERIRQILAQMEPLLDPEILPEAAAL